MTMIAMLLDDRSSIARTASTTLARCCCFVAIAALMLVLVQGGSLPRVWTIVG